MNRYTIYKLSPDCKELSKNEQGLLFGKEIPDRDLVEPVAIVEGLDRPHRLERNGDRVVIGADGQSHGILDIVRGSTPGVSVLWRDNQTLAGII